MVNDVFILGSGGHASVLVDVLKQNKIPLSGLFTPDEYIKNNALCDIPTFKDEDDIFLSDPKKILLVNGVGSLPRSELRAKLYKKFSDKHYTFLQVISEKAIISDFATLGEGVQVMPGAIIQAGAVIGENSIINSGVIIEHDCVIGNHNHIAPGATLCGQVKTGNHVHIGTGANIIQNISISDNVIVGVGANITQDVSCNKTVWGARSEIKTTRLIK